MDKGRYEIFTKILLKNNKTGIIVDYLGPDYVVDIGATEDEYDTIIVKADEIKCIIEK